MRFVKTNKSIDGHYHLVFIEEERGAGITNIEDGHFHQVIFDPQVGGWTYSFEGEGSDIHSHVSEDFSPTYPKSKEEESKIVNDVYGLFQEWTENESDSVKNARKAEDYYWGDQWEHGDKEYLASKGRAALTINKIERMVDQLVGEQRQERTDLRYYPQEEGDQVVSDILNQVSKLLLEKNGFEQEKSAVFEDMVVTGKGVFDLWVDFSKSIEGEIKVDRFQWDNVVFAPFEKMDLSDCDGYVKHKMYSKAKLKNMFPEKEDEISKLFDSLNVLGNRDEPGFLSDTTGNSINMSGGVPLQISGYSNLDISKKSLRLYECWRREYKTSYVIVDATRDFFFAAEGWSSALVNKAKKFPDGMFSVVPKESSHIRISKICGTVLLSDEYPADLPSQDFYVVPVFGKKKNGKWKGKVIGGIDPQNEINRRHSQAMDIGNQAGYGWFFDNTTFGGDKKSERDFFDNIATPNFKLKVQDVRHGPMKQEGGKFPAEIVQLMQVAEQSLMDTVAIDFGAPGGANQSAAHFLATKKSRLLPNEHLFDNISFATRRVGSLLIKMMQKYYSPDRMLRILTNNAARSGGSDKMMIGGQPLSSYSPEQVYQLLQTADLNQYDVLVGESSYSPTARLGTFMVLREMAQSGAPIPPDLMIEFLDIPEDVKNKVRQSLAAQAQAQSQEMQIKANMEKDKSLIAKGIIPAEEQARVQGQQ